MGLIAYASVAQMGLVTISIFTLNEHGVQGAVFEMLSHSIVAAGLIICANIFIQRMQTGHGSSSIKLINQIPNCSLVLIFFVLAFIGVPGTAGFIGPLLILLGAFKYNIVLACFVAFSLILVAVYMLYSCKRIFFSIGENATGKIIKDLSLPDSLVLIPIIALVIFVGVYPMPFLELISISVKNVIGNHNIITGR
jgi:NADH-quinone oxidoreductase subunit M